MRRNDGEPLPTTLEELAEHFADPDVAVRFVAKLRWPFGPTCPRCGSRKHSYLKTRFLWKCSECKKQYSVKVGTMFEGSRLGFDKWLPAIWWVANSPRGISSHGLARRLGITQKSAWFMVDHIRRAQATETFKQRQFSDRFTAYVRREVSAP